MTTARKPEDVALGEARDASENRLRLALEASGSETLYRSLAEQLPNGAAFIVDRDLRYRMAHGKALAAAGYTSSDFEGRTLAEVLPPALVASYEPRYRAALEGCSFEHEHTSHGRSYVTLGVPLRDAGGGIHAVLALSYDITERTRVEQTLRERESFFRQTIGAIPGMVFTNTPDGACEFVSEQWVAFTGVPAAEQLGAGWVELLHPEDRPRAFAAWRAAVDSGGDFDTEYRIRRTDGVHVWFKVRARPMRDADGGVVRWFGTAIDIDDSKRAAAAIVARERELQSLTDNSPDIITRFDRELRHVFVSAAVERATGLRPEQLVGRTNRELGMPEALCARWEQLLRAVFDDAAPQTIEFEFETREGVRHYAARFVPETGPDGRVQYALGVTHDVTEQRRAQRVLEEADRRKDEFLATLAHELRNPLAPLRNGLDVLRRADPYAAVVAKVQAMMDRQLHHLVRLVDDLLDVSRIRRGAVELTRERLVLQSVLEHAVETSQPAIEAGGHRLVVDVPAAPIEVVGDLTRLAQVVANLLHNAAKYTPPGGHITLSLRTDDGRAVIRVSDDGVGISAEALPRVFELFAQVGSSRELAQGGLGIGLSLAHRLVALHGGTIEAASQGKGKGSTFTVRLPLAVASRAAEVIEASATADPRTGRRVLVVDDNIDGAESLAMLLELSGHVATTAEDGFVALERAREIEPEVIFLDLGLPGIDGYEVARRLRADPRTARAVIVALTGWGSDEDRVKTREAGFDLHLTKPVKAEAVVDVLARLDER